MAMPIVESAISSGSITKPVKLRESCDSCLLAKVKCSKSRPVCSRCLSNGAPCDYSPSSRSGKRNRNGTNGPKNAGIQKASDVSRSSTETSLPSNIGMLNRFTFSLLGGERSLSNQGIGTTGCSMTPPFLHTVPSSKAMPSGDPISFSDGENIDPTEYLPTPPFSHSDSVDSYIPFADPHGHGHNFTDFLASPHSPVFSFDTMSCDSTWRPKDNPGFRATEFPGAFDAMYSGFMEHAIRPDPHTNGLHSPHHEPPVVRAIDGDGQSCDCFAACLHVLQSLHNHSTLLPENDETGPPFDIVLTINREAIESCSKLLDCGHCVFKNGRSVSTMMLATIFGKVMSLYRAACSLRFGSSIHTQSSAQLAFGAYTVTGENRQLLEIEILLLELRKLEKTLQTYADQSRQGGQSSDSQHETGVYGALTLYLEENLKHIVDFLQARKGGP